MSWKDVAEVSPFEQVYLNWLGCYSFAGRPPYERMRPLRDPAAVQLGERRRHELVCQLSKTYLDGISVP